MWRIESLGARCGWLFAVLAGLWVICLWPSWVLFGAEGFEALTTSVVVCLLSGCLVFVVAFALQAPSQQLQVLLLGTGLRIGAGLIAAWWLGSVRQFSTGNYLVWLGLAYLVTLMFEAILLAKSAEYQAGKANPASQDSLGGENREAPVG